MTTERSDQTPGSGGPPDGFRDSTQEPPDLVRLHKRVVAREQIEPAEGNEKTPWWLWTFNILLLFAMGFYIGRYGGSFSGAVHEVEEPPALPTATAAQVPAPKGDMIYRSICQPCHQAGGQGVPGQFPPLIGSEWLAGPGDVPIRILLYGLSGPMRVKGVAYNNTMPPFSGRLTNGEIAAVLTYVRSAWGNNGSAVTAAEVDSVQKAIGQRGPWAPAEIMAQAR